MSFWRFSAYRRYNTQVLLPSLREKSHKNTRLAGCSKFRMSEFCFRQGKICSQIKQFNKNFNEV
jgi:hypothetical protein